MERNRQALGFEYFSSADYLVQKRVREWMPVLKQLGATAVIFQSGYDKAIPEDTFLAAKEYQLTPVVHFTTELPLARKFNEVAFLMDVYAKWGVSEVIFGDKPNIKSSWTATAWHYDNIVDHFLDRFIPLANQAVRAGLNPALPPLQPGGNFWDTAFIELVLGGLKRRQMEGILDCLSLTSYGYTFNKSFSWGAGGPERWLGVKPYQTPEGQEDQLGFNNYAWQIAMGLRATGKDFPISILDAGSSGMKFVQSNNQTIGKAIKTIYASILGQTAQTSSKEEPQVRLDDSVKQVFFSLDNIAKLLQNKIAPRELIEFFKEPKHTGKTNKRTEDSGKVFDHYLLLPAYTSGISDVILNKIRPLIKHRQTTVGFSTREAKFARKVSIYPDPIIFSDDVIEDLRSAGCTVEILPDSGIDIATMIQKS
jgi:hypothetical protein